MNKGYFIAKCLRVKIPRHKGTHSYFSYVLSHLHNSFDDEKSKEYVECLCAFAEFYNIFFEIFGPSGPTKYQRNLLLL